MYPQQKKSGAVTSCGGQSQPAKQTGDIFVEIKNYSTASPKKPVTGINIELTKDGATAGKGSTDSKGRLTFSGLDLGSYTVTLKMGPSLTRIYDPVPPPRTKGVFASKTTTFYFELRYYSIAFSVTYPDGSKASSVAYELRQKKITGAQQIEDADWSSYKTGNTTSDDYSEDYVAKGRYQLRIKAVENVAWSKPQVLVGEAIDLTADATGMDDGTAGSFDIFDARNLAASIYSISATTAANALKATWTPSASQLTSLKSGWIVAQAKVGAVQAFSPEVKVATKTEYDVVDKAGKNLDAKLKFTFSAGDQLDADAVGGKAQVPVPWNQTVTRIDMPDQKTSRVEFATDSGTQKFILP